MRKFIAGACAASLVFAGAGYAAKHGGQGLSLQKQADLRQIENIERTWHKAASKKNLDLMMSIWAPNATMTIGGKTYTGKQAIRGLFAKAGPFQPQNHWISDTAAYKIRVTVNGAKGTLYFECHYIDLDTQKVATVVAADQEVRKLNGRWLITDLTASSATLTP
jgi:ketosteroid isomerase-like protein